MGTIDHQVSKAQRRLWFNRWLRQWGWMLTLVTIGWVLLWVADRLFSLKWPMGWVALIGLGVSFMGSLIWLVLTRDHPLAAAAALDQAAGLRERVSTSLDVRPDSKDPFARAVVADAERAVAGLTPRKFLPIRWAGSLSLSGIVVLVALLSLLLPEFDLLNRDPARNRSDALAAMRQRQRAILAKPVSALKDVIKKNPDLNLDNDFNKMEDGLNDRKTMDPGFRRREVVKQLNSLQDALKKKAGAERFQAMKETKKRLRQIGEPSDPKSELRLLMDSLTAGDFEEAEKEVKKLQEKLARHARDGKLDREQLKKMEKQLQELGKKLQKAAQDKESQRELQNAGMSKEEAERVLQNLAKKDPEQLKKMAKELSERLKKQGVTEEQMKEMLQKMQERQKACQKCNKMGEKMGKAAKAMEQGDLEQAQSELGEAGDMLNEMEQLEQDLNDLESQMSQLDDVQDDMEDYDPENDELSCKQCDGTGFLPDGSPCPGCNGTGRPGGGGRGRGWGDRQRDDSAKTSTVNRRAKTKRGRGGSIIAQQFVKGKQLKGESTVEFEDALSAGEIDRTDTMDRGRIPRQYQGPVKRFFDRLGEDYKDAKPADEKKTEEKPSAGE